jgi:hypothetical protein
VERIVPAMQYPCGAIVRHMRSMLIKLTHDRRAPLDSTSTPLSFCTVPLTSLVESMGEHSAGA